MQQEEQQFQKALDDYWKKVQEIYTPYANQDIDKDRNPLLYYVFQTDVHYNPDLMIVGINPGASYHGKPFLCRKDEHGIVQNYYLLGAEEDAWARRLQSVFDYKQDVNNNSYLSSVFENCVGTNKVFINTRIEKGCLSFKDIHPKAKALLEELIQIVKPKHIVALGRSPFDTLKQCPVKQIKDSGINFKYSKYNGIPLAYIPNPSGLCSRYYNTEEKVNFWKERITEFLKDELYK